MIVDLGMESLIRMETLDCVADTKTVQITVTFTWLLSLLIDAAKIRWVWRKTRKWDVISIVFILNLWSHWWWNTSTLATSTHLCTKRVKSHGQVVAEHENSVNVYRNGKAFLLCPNTLIWGWRQYEAKYTAAYKAHLLGLPTKLPMEVELYFISWGFRSQITSCISVSDALMFSHAPEDCYSN